MCFYINICNNILSVHENFPMIASMPSCFSFFFLFFLIFLWKCALYSRFLFLFLKIRPPYYFPHNQKGAFWKYFYISLQKSQHFVSKCKFPITASLHQTANSLCLLVESPYIMTVFSDNKTNLLLKKALALWLNPES